MVTWKLLSPQGGQSGPYLRGPCKQLPWESDPRARRQSRDGAQNVANSCCRGIAFRGCLGLVWHGRKLQPGGGNTNQHCNWGASSASEPWGKQRAGRNSQQSRQSRGNMHTRRLLRGERRGEVCQRRCSNTSRSAVFMWSQSCHSV